MGIRLKFNLLFTGVFLLGLVASGLSAYYILQQNAKEEVLHTASVMLSSASAIRGYTISEIKPLLTRQQRRQFLPQSVPAYAATQNIRRLQKNHPDYIYKEATLNPTNPQNRATSWEVDIIEWFNNHPEKKEFIGQRQTPTGPSLFLSRPIVVKQEACLNCHGIPSEAPETMKVLYGTANGFGWKHGSIIGAQIVSIPMTVPYQRAETALVTFLGSLVGVFFLVAILLNIFLNTMIINRIKKMSKIAKDISLGENETEEFDSKGKDEISSLAASFNRMRLSLTNAMDMLEETTQMSTKTKIV